MKNTNRHSHKTHTHTHRQTTHNTKQTHKTSNPSQPPTKHTHTNKQQTEQTTAHTNTEHQNAPHNEIMLQSACNGNRKPEPASHIIKHQLSKCQNSNCMSQVLSANTLELHALTRMHQIFCPQRNTQRIVPLIDRLQSEIQCATSKAMSQNIAPMQACANAITTHELASGSPK